MITSKTVTVDIERTVSLSCDRCGKTVSTKDDPDAGINDIFESQEFLSFSDTAGYGNRVVGDGTRWSIDLCQDCVKEILGPYIKVL